MVIADSGDVKVSGSTLDLIGEAITESISRRNDPAVRNQVLYIHSTVFTQKQLLGYARAAAPERTIKTITVDTEKVAEAAWEKYDAGERDMDALRPLMLRTSFGLGLGVFKQVNNDVLGLSMLTDSEVEALVAKVRKS